MLMTELIDKKRDGGALSAAEIEFFIRGYTAGIIPDYQVSALLMAMYFRGLDRAETAALTDAMMRSGETVDLSPVSGVKADKHSTGGVGDKTSLVLCPMLAACGVKIAKMSGRGLGHTGGTIDKLESFPGFTCALSRERFLSNVERIGIAIAAQTADIDPADKKLYALRNVTGTVAVRGLIASSIMSKKLAAGADVIVLDVKCGSGGFMKTEADARALAEEMVAAGRAAGRHCAAVITDMDEPLGFAVGNALEVREAIAALRGETCGHLTELCLALGTQVLLLGGLAADGKAARARLEEALRSGAALEKLRALVAAQGGDARAVDDPALLPTAPVQLRVPSEESGYVNHIDADQVGRVCLHLGGGRAEKDSVIDLSVGVLLRKKVGDRVERGEELAVVHAAGEEKAAEAAAMLRGCYHIAEQPPLRGEFVKGVVM